MAQREERYKPCNIFSAHSVKALGAILTLTNLSQTLRQFLGQVYKNRLFL